MTSTCLKKVYLKEPLDCTVYIFLLVPHFHQEAVAQGFEREHEVFGSPESYFQLLPATLSHKRDKLASCLTSVGLKPIMPEGGYFLTADFSSLSKSDKEDLNSPMSYINVADIVVS